MVANMFIGALISFAILVASWMILPAGGAEADPETLESKPIAAERQPARS